MSDVEKFNQAMAALSAVRDTAGINLKGKIYSQVKDRIEIFRRNFGSEFRIDTNIDYPQGFDRGAAVVAIAKVLDTSGLVVASGHAMERVGSSNINTTNPVEMAETSAIGRALACFGLGGGEYASSDEMVAFFSKQAITPDVSHETPKSVVVPAAPSNRYVPKVEEKAVWYNPQNELKKVLEALENVKDVQALGKYWSELQAFRNSLEAESKMLLAELKAAFASRNNQLAG